MSRYRVVFDFGGGVIDDTALPHPTREAAAREVEAFAADLLTHPLFTASPEPDGDGAALRLDFAGEPYGTLRIVAVTP